MDTVWVIMAACCFVEGTFPDLALSGEAIVVPRGLPAEGAVLPCWAGLPVRIGDEDALLPPAPSRLTGRRVTPKGVTRPSEAARSLSA